MKSLFLSQGRRLRQDDNDRWQQSAALQALPKDVLKKLQACQEEAQGKSQGLLNTAICDLDYATYKSPFSKGRLDAPKDGR